MSTVAAGRTAVLDPEGAIPGCPACRPCGSGADETATRPRALVVGLTASSAHVGGSVTAAGNDVRVSLAVPTGRPAA